jgi:Rieske Fe-S protein
MKKCAGCSGHELERRTLLKGGAAAGALLLVLPSGCGNQTVAPPTGPVGAGNVKDVAIGYLQLVPGEAVILGRDAGGLYAMSDACTHQGCPVQVAGAGASLHLGCPCHGAQYDVNGVVTRGPAPRDLQHYQVDVAADGTITVQGGMPVAADARTPVP